MAAKRERSAYNQAWRASHKERLREKAREYRDKNRERIRAYHRAWCARNSERVKAYGTPEARARYSEKQRARYRNDPVLREQRKAASKRWHQNRTPEQRAKEREYHKRWRATPVGKRKARHQWLKRYGTTLAEYNDLLQKQSGVCAICKKSPKPHRSRAMMILRVDHDHQDDHIRGLLCHNCNAGLGMLGDTVQALEAAIGYLRHDAAQWLAKRTTDHTYMAVKQGTPPPP